VILDFHFTFGTVVLMVDSRAYRLGEENDDSFQLLRFFREGDDAIHKQVPAHLLSIDSLVDHRNFTNSGNVNGWKIEMVGTVCTEQEPRGHVNSHIAKEYVDSILFRWQLPSQRQNRFCLIAIHFDFLEPEVVEALKMFPAEAIVIEGCVVLIAFLLAGQVDSDPVSVS